uniref:HYDIN/VesB/CFA65-like Ig-like domain-containing protein n=1 Tax=Zonotrichia albicollis TaxID=44394 RepID=A0A8D2QHH9_ZONAL
FEVSPPEMVFENIVAHEVYEMALSLMNKDKFPQVVKVSMESSPYFQLMSSNNAYRVVLPGASAPVRIRFTPDESKDYSHEFVCVTARERIVVPIVAIGARAVLDLPAQLDFSKCPVKHSTQQTLLVRNVGNVKARYQLSTPSPFSVVPATGILGAGETLKVTVTFHPLTKGDHSKTLLCFVPGEEKIHTKLHGEAVDVNVGLSTNSVHVDTTYITTSTHRTVFIENRSNITAHFQWKAFPTEERENEVKRRLKLEVSPKGYLLGEEKGSYLLLQHQELVASSLENAMRLPLRLRGEGQGPLVEFSSHTLNIGNVFVNSSHIHEHTGLCWLETQGALGPGFVPPSHNSRTIAMPLTEPLPALSSRGSVTVPSLEFDVDEINFGEISFGFPHTQCCRLTNSSPVPVTFQLRMSDDGTQPAVDSLDQIRREGDPSWRNGIHFYLEPKEFSINPSQGTILPQGHQDIEVTLCSNSVVDFYRRMLVDLEGFGKGVTALVITARYQCEPVCSCSWQGAQGQGLCRGKQPQAAGEKDRRDGGHKQPVPHRW